MPSKGVTLIELILVVALIALGCLVAYPSLRGLSLSTAARSDAMRLLASLHLARSYAVLNRLPVDVCGLAALNTNSCGGAFNAGWVVLVSAGGPEASPPTAVPAGAGADSPERRVLRAESGASTDVAIRRRDGVRAASLPLTYRADGTTGRGETFRFCVPPKTGLMGWRVVVSATGRPRLARDHQACDR